MDKNYLILLKNVNKLPMEQAHEVRDALNEDIKFLKQLKTKFDFTWEEHDGLLHMLDFKKFQGYYKDKYDHRVSYNGIATLKSPGTEMPLTNIHKIEIEKIKESHKYFTSLYCKITTREGIARGENREYQERLDEAFLSGEDLVVSFSRQSGKTVGAAKYILWNAISRENPFNAGIVGNRDTTAAEVLDKIKKILVELPIWATPCMDSWNTRSIEFENGTRIMTSRPHGDAFRGFTISLLYCDEVAYFNFKEWEDFKDSVFPTMNSLIVKQSIFTSTMKGLNFWAAMVKGAREGVNGYTLVENDWKEVPRFDKQGNKLTPAEYRASLVEKYGEVFFKSTEENEPMGSSVTLLGGESLKLLRSVKPKQIPELFHEINVYKEVQPGHSYVIGVDPSGDGIDNFSIQVIDVTQFPFEQVAAAGLQVDYMLMPERIVEIGKYYNNAFITVETNDGIGTSVVDNMFYTYEYENLFKDRDANDKGYKKRHGLRNTRKSRNLLLGIMKTFIEENKLVINDETTIQELFTFELNHNGKYIAADGNKDDMVMSLAISLAPFMHIKMLDDPLLFLKAIRADLTKEQSVETADFYSLIAINMDTAEEDNEMMTHQERLQRIRENGNINENQFLDDMNSLRLY